MLILIFQDTSALQLSAKLICVGKDVETPAITRKHREPEWEKGHPESVHRHRFAAMAASNRWIVSWIALAAHSNLVASQSRILTPAPAFYAKTRVDNATRED